MARVVIARLSASIHIRALFQAVRNVSSVSVMMMMMTV